MIDNTSSFFSFPKITIVTPSYNQAPFLEETILSVLNQDYTNIEYIIIDGGSTDGSVDIIQKYENCLACWISEPDMGQAHAINKGFRRATGKILAWLNSDDTYEKDSLFYVAKSFMNNPDQMLVYGDGWYIDERGKTKSKCAHIRPFDANLLKYVDYILQPCAFWRRNLWMKVGELDETLHWGFDWEWWVRASKITEFRYVPVHLANHREQPNQKTITGGRERMAELARISRRIDGWKHPTNLMWQFQRFAYFCEPAYSSLPDYLGNWVRRCVCLPSHLITRHCNKRWL